MIRGFTSRARHIFALAAVLVLSACAGEPAGLGAEDRGLEFVDGPADHVVGGVIPAFRIWVTDLFGRRATGLQGGTLTLDLLAPGGATQTSGFATVPLSFGEGRAAPTVSLPAAAGYSVRARFEGVTLDSPPFSVVAAPDLVRMTNVSAGEVGLIVDGANNIGRLQDSTHRTTTAEVDVGVLNSGALTHSVAVFAPDRRAELVQLGWTSAPDIVTVALRDPVLLPVTVWIVTGSFATEKAQVETALATLSQEWAKERAGVAIGDVQFRDATSLSAQFEVFVVPMGAGPFSGLAAGVGRDAGRFNVYVVLSARDATSALVGGFSEQPGTAMVVTSAAVTSSGARVFGHEFGHNFGLRDTNNLEGFLIDGNMMTTGLNSMNLTEGQTFRAHFDRFSALRGFRTGDAFNAPSCNPLEATTDCPALELRVWAETDPAATVISPG